MKRFYLTLLSSLVTLPIWATSPAPSPASDMTKLLTQIATNTNHTATATGTTLNQQLQTLLASEKLNAKTAQTNQQRYVYANSTNDQYINTLSQALNSTQESAQNANNQAIHYDLTTIDQPLICGNNPSFISAGICPANNKNTFSQINGMVLLNQTQYASPATAQQFVNNIFTMAMNHDDQSQLPSLSLAAATYIHFLQQHTPNNHDQSKPSSPMALLSNLVRTPMSTTWQTNLSQASQSDRIRALVSLTATANYLQYLRLKTEQQRNLLAATAIIQRAKIDTDIQAQTQAISRLTQHLQSS